MREAKGETAHLSNVCGYWRCCRLGVLLSEEQCERQETWREVPEKRGSKRNVVAVFLYNASRIIPRWGREAEHKRRVSGPGKLLSGTKDELEGSGLQQKPLRPMTTEKVDHID